MSYNGDLTIIYITASELSERWYGYQLDHLRHSANGAAIISVSRKPMSLGYNIIDNEPKSYWNIYMQMLRAAILADTPYVAIAEDDTLYTIEHFAEFRPPMDKVSYDRSRWSLFSWDPLYCMRQRVSNCSLIAPRDLLIEALTERKNKYIDAYPPNNLVGEVGREKVDRRLGVTVRPCVEWYCTNPIVQLNHPSGTDNGSYGTTETGRRLIKKHGQIKAYNIPYWGKAKEVVKFYGTK